MLQEVTYEDIRFPSALDINSLIKHGLKIDKLTIKLDLIIS